MMQLIDYRAIVPPAHDSKCMLRTSDVFASMRQRIKTVWGTTNQQPHLQNVFYLLKPSQLIFAGSLIFPGTVNR